MGRLIRAIITGLSILILVALFGCATSNSPQLQPEQARFISIEGRPYDIAFADFNGDSLTDMAVIVKYAGLYIFHNNGKTPDFDNPSVYNNFSPHGTSLDMGDFNGDGIPDIVYATEDYAQVLLNLHNRFDSLVLKGPRMGFFVRAGDFNRDGITDFAMTGMDDTNVYIYLSSGPGLFNLVKVPVQSQSESNPFSAKAFSIADVNADGYPDLLIPDPKNSALWFLENRSGREFVPLRIYETPLAEKKLAYARFLKHDGKHAYIAVLAGTYNPELIILTLGNGETMASVASRYSLPLTNPVFLDIVSEANGTYYLLITHNTALSIIKTDLGDFETVATFPVSEPFSASAVMARYSADLGAVIVACQKKDGIAFIPFALPK